MSVFSKLDWYTVILHDCSINDILSKLRIDASVYDEFCNSGFLRSEGYSSRYVFALSGIQIEVGYDLVFPYEDHIIDFMGLKVEKIRLDISGSGLDYLRSRDFDVDAWFSLRGFWDGFRDPTFTRIDVAFDFVNYPCSLVYPLMDYIKTKEMSGEFVPHEARLSTGRRGGVQYRYYSGEQRTIYLGARRSDKMLRIYDKKLQYTRGGIWVKPVPLSFLEVEDDVKTWERVEFQLRRDACNIVFDNEMRDVLKLFFEQFAIRDNVTGEVLPFIRDFYDWKKIPAIIQNKNFTEKKPYIEKCRSFLSRQAFKSIFCYIAKFGLHNFVSYINQRSVDIFEGKDPSSVYSSLALARCLAQVVEEDGGKPLEYLQQIGNTYLLKFNDKE